MKFLVGMAKSGSTSTVLHIGKEKKLLVCTLFYILDMQHFHPLILALSLFFPYWCLNVQAQDGILGHPLFTAVYLNILF